MGNFKEKSAREAKLRELRRRLEVLRKEEKKLVPRLFTKSEFLEFINGGIKAGDSRFDRVKLARLIEVEKKQQKVGEEIFRLDSDADRVTKAVAAEMTQDEKNESLTKGFSFREGEA